MDAGPKTAGRTTRSGNSRKHPVAKFSRIMGRGASDVFVDLGPDHFCGIQLGSRRRKFVDEKAWMACNEIVDLGAAGDGMSVPEKHERSSDRV